MYHSHFALRNEPFGVSPDPGFFLETAQHAEALATLYYGIRQRRGFGLLTGGAGLGKTSILVQLLKRLKSEAETACLPHPYFDRDTVLESILASLGLESTNSVTGNYRLFHEFLVKTQRAGKTCVVVFDEAQNLNLETLEAIRTLSNFETPVEKLVQIVLSGQPGLAVALGRPEYEQIRQRLNMVARLKPLDAASIREYINHRLKIAGGALSLFTPEAIESIIQASLGVPRNVNTICFSSLTLAYALNRRQVGNDEVAEVLRDLDLTATGETSGSSKGKREMPADASRPSAWNPASSADSNRRTTLIAASTFLLAIGALWLRT